MAAGLMRADCSALRWVVRARNRSLIAGVSSLELRVRSIPAPVSSRAGFLVSSEELADPRPVASNAGGAVSLAA